MCTAVYPGGCSRVGIPGWCTSLYTRVVYTRLVSLPTYTRVVYAQHASLYIPWVVYAQQASLCITQVVYTPPCYITRWYIRLPSTYPGGIPPWVYFCMGDTSVGTSVWEIPP